MTLKQKLHILGNMLSRFLTAKIDEKINTTPSQQTPGSYLAKKIKQRHTMLLSEL